MLGFLPSDNTVWLFEQSFSHKGQPFLWFIYTILQTSFSQIL
ncbi:hypothetical protein Bsph_3584 [Lysinibacillus sphaericus C3-41]|uniref:Uncharacterized protein n=1 Tax=Lysinibacillus sphaericus (strain C3-41) TaxID=444177 RepID=B1HSL2_LYSSC|nr:hypothetical protein Bsph_3584 [Lysinibacillus sphaericus C3-41]